VAKRLHIGRVQQATDAADDDVCLCFEDGFECRILRGEPRLDAWRQITEECRRDGEPIAVRVDEATGTVAAMLVPMLKQIVQVESIAPDGTLFLDVRRSPSRYVLRSVEPDYIAMRALLEESIRTRGWMWVTRESSTMEIVHVRRPNILVRGGW
jgi:hypothetical protein